jgi:cobalt/nickel transport system permease protein
LSALCNHSLELTGLAGDPDSPVHRLDPRAKLLGFLAITLVAVTTPLAAWPVFAAAALVLVAVALVARITPGDVWRRVRFILPLILLAAIFLPLVRHGGATYDAGPLTLHEHGMATLATVSVKALIGTFSAVLLGATTTFPQVLRGLELMRAPRLLLLIASFMYRYLFVIVEEAGRMRAALAARAYRPRHALHAAAIGRMATAMFLRTFARGERVYHAMLARGYNGHLPQLTPSVLRRADVAFVALVLAALVPLRVALGVAA